MITPTPHTELVCGVMVSPITVLWGQLLRSKEGSMGYELRRRLREVLGPEITGLQRAIALEIADDANDVTRESFVSLEDLARWSGAKDTSVVRTTLKRLAAAGWEFRVAIGAGKDGRALYAVPGKRMTFLVPEFEGGTTATPSEPKGEQGIPQGVTPVPSEGTGVPPSDQQGGTVVPSEGTTVSSEGTTVPSEGTGVTPFPSSPQLLIPSASQPEEPAEQHAYGIPDTARPLVDAMTKAGVVVRWPFQGDGWFPVLALIQKSGVPAMVDHAVRAAARRDGDVDSAKFFMKGWRELPPLPPPGQGTFLLSIEGGGEGAAPPRRRSTTDERVAQAIEAGRRLQALADAQKAQEAQ